MGYATNAGDIISTASPLLNSGAMIMSTSLNNFGRSNSDPIRMFARRDAFRTVAEAIAQNIAGVPFDLYERDEENGRQKLGILDDPLAYTLQKPAGRTTPFRWKEALMLDLVLHDRWCFMPRLTDSGRWEFIRIPGAQVSFVIDAYRQVTDVALYNSNGEKMIIPARHFIFDYGYDPADPTGEVRGFGVSHTLEAANTELEKGAAFRDALLSGGPKVPMFITRPANAPAWIKSGERDRFIQSFKAYSGEKAGEVPILEDGMSLSKAPSLSADDIEYKEIRLAAQIEFAIAMHFPPELIGYRTGTNSNLDTLREQLLIDVLGTKIIAFREALNVGLRDVGILADNRYIEENIGIRLQGDPEKQAGILQTQVGAPVRTVNEARRILNLPPVDGGDDLIVPLNVVKGGLASPTDTAPKEITVDEVDPAGGKARAITRGTKSAAGSQRDRFADDLSKFFVRQSSRVRKSLGTDNVPNALDQAFDTNVENADLATIIYPHAYALAQVAAAEVLDRYNPDRDNWADEVMQPYLAKTATGMSAAINSSTFRKLAGAMFTDDWQRDVDAVLEANVNAQAGVWAQTIATASRSFGKADAAKATGLDQKSWRASGSDSRHAAIDGETVPIAEVFSNGLRWPGDPHAEVADRVSCHCEIEYSKAP